MTYQRQVISILLLTLLPLTATAQSNGTNSSYSRYGLGLLCDQSQGYNRSMGGVGQALRSGNRLNKLNPASYSAIDSLSFLFDVGMSLQRTRMAAATRRPTTPPSTMSLRAGVCAATLACRLALCHIPTSATTSQRRRI